jgi:hypothetical protein
LKSSPPAFYIQNLKKKIKKTWLHMELVFILSTANGRAKLGRSAAKQLLTLVLLQRMKG